MCADTVARLKITLDHVKPSVWRRIEVPLTLKLDRLHLVIQSAMGWTDSHLYEIRSGDVGWGRIDPDEPDDMLDASKVRLGDVIKDVGTKAFKYLYDFGDGWEHTVKVERLIDAEPGIEYPRLINAAGRCPPEDVGGPWGYDDFLDAIGDPKHERHTELREWIGGDFNPDVVDADDRAGAVSALAKYWRPKVRAKRRRPA